MQRAVNRLAATALAIGLALTGCSTYVPAPAQVPASLESGFAATAPMQTPAVTASYPMRPGDELRMRFLYHKELDTTGKIRDDGQITVPGLGDFLASGLSTEQLEANVYRRASLTYRDPQVSVVVDRATDFRAYVGGEVRRPGFVPIRDGMTSLRAIFESGGFLDTAKVDHVLHVRWGEQGAYSAKVVNLKHVLETGDMREDVLLGPNDVVYVPKTAVANADLWVRQYLIELIPLREPTTRLDDFK
jgi:polysaccharide export outer membrane protein